MTLRELIDRFRVLANDRVQPYFWTDADVARWLSDAQAQAAVRARLLREDADQDVCNLVNFRDNVSKLHESVVEIVSLRLVDGLGSRPRSLHLVSSEWLTTHMPDWRECREPVRFAIQDDRALRLVGELGDSESVWLTCYRLPLSPLENDGDAPEINPVHHAHLLDWALSQAFSIPDSEAFDPQRAALAAQAFTAYFGAMPDSDLRRTTRVDVPHHNTLVLP